MSATAKIAEKMATIAQAGAGRTGTVTLTFGEVAENGQTMEQLGSKARHGFSLADLERCKAAMEERGCKCILYHLNELLPMARGSDHRVEATDAWILVVWGGVEALLSGEEDEKNTGDRSVELALLEEQHKLVADVKKYDARTNSVRNSIARHNLCFAEAGHVADYRRRQGTVVSFADVPVLDKMRATLPDVLGEEARDLFVEGNYYYDVETTYIGFHGDAERRKVVGVRLGEGPFPLHYQWYLHSQHLGDRLEIELNGGDFYVMSEYAVGTNWKTRTVPTLRHAAGKPHKTRVPVDESKEPVRLVRPVD